MANTFAEKAVSFMPMLDEIYTRESLTSFLEMNPMVVMFNGTNAVKLPKIVIDGHGDYDRATGFVQGDIAVSYGSYTLQYDRGRKFNVDVIDDDEAAFEVFAEAATEFVRTKEIPEIDATRFSEIYAKADAGSGTIVAGDGAAAELTASNALSAYDDAEQTLFDNEVTPENMIMWVSSTYYKLLKQDTGITRRIDAGDVSVNGINRRVELLDGITPLIRVPVSRFYDVIQLNDGTTAGQEAGGFEPIALTSKKLNFILADRVALNAVTKRRVSKIIGWEQNQTLDANAVYYRLHHDLIVPDNKTPGIYINTEVAAIS